MAVIEVAILEFRFPELKKIFTNKIIDDNAIVIYLTFIIMVFNLQITNTQFTYDNQVFVI